MSNKVSTVGRGCDSNAQGSLVVGIRSRLKCHTGMDGWCRWTITTQSLDFHLVDASSGITEAGPGLPVNTRRNPQAYFPAHPLGRSTPTEQKFPRFHSPSSIIVHHSIIPRSRDVHPGTSHSEDRHIRHLYLANISRRESVVGYTQAAVSAGPSRSTSSDIHLLTQFHHLASSHHESIVRKDQYLSKPHTTRFQP
jgi:hypothetical protein